MMDKPTDKEWWGKLVRKAKEEGRLSAFKEMREKTQEKREIIRKMGDGRSDFRRGQKSIMSWLLKEFAEAKIKGEE